MEFQNVVELETGHRWRDRLSARRMRLGTVIAGVLPALIALIADPLRETVLAYVPLTIVAIGLAMIVIFPLLVLAAGSWVTARIDAHTDYRKLRLTGTPASEVAESYLESIQFHLRYLWAFGWGAAAGVFVALTHILVNSYLNIELCSGFGRGDGGNPIGGSSCGKADMPFETIPYGVPIALVAVALGVFLVMVLCVLAAQSGAYVGMRFPHDRSTALVPISLFSVGIALGVAYLIFRWPHLIYVITIMLILGIPLISTWLTHVISRSVEGLIAKRMVKTASGYIPPPPV